MNNDQNAVIEGEFKQIEDIDQAPVVPSVREKLTRPKLKDKMEVVIKYGSALTPGNVVMLGTGDINNKYRAWLEKRFAEGLTSNDPSKKMTKERVSLYQTVQALCYMAVCEDETEVVTYKWDGPVFKRKFYPLKIEEIVREFVKAKFDILYAIAPFFGVKINRTSSSSQSSVTEDPLPVQEPELEESKTDIVV